MKNKKLNIESGRSLVEMLGVLAVMGVLSVAGIAGYNNAMNKYRANELLNESNKRATVVAMQIAAGRAEGQLSISEFNNTIFSESISYTPTTGRFSFTLSGVDSAICQQMKTMVGDKTQIRKINPDCTLITYNADLSTNDKVDVGECDNGYMYLSYRTNPCVEDTSDPAFLCQKNSDCEVEEYCQVDGEYAQIKPNQSKCTSLDTGSAVTFKGKDFYVGASRSWWSAENWCKAHGKELASLADLGLTGNETCNQTTNPKCTDPRTEEENAYWDAFKAAFGANKTFFVKDVNREKYPTYIYTQNNCGLPGASRSLHYMRSPICK